MSKTIKERLDIIVNGTAVDIRESFNHHNINDTDNNELTELHLAAKHGEYGEIEFFIELGANLEARTNIKNFLHRCNIFFKLPVLRRLIL